MLHVIAGFAADAALVHGAYGAAFRGFYVRAVREVMASGLCVKLTVTGRQGYRAADDLAYCAMMLNADEFDERWHAQFSCCGSWNQ